MRPIPTLVAIPAVLLLAVGLAGCGAPDTTADPSPTTSETASAEPATEIVEITPWGEDGALSSEWTIDSEAQPGGTVDSEFCRASEHGTGDNTLSCGTTADSTSACWITESPMQMACLNEGVPDARTLELISLSGAAPATTSAVEEPLPLWLELDDGSVFVSVNGGAFSPPTGYLVAYVAVSGADAFEEIVVPDDESAPTIDTSTDLWGVTVGVDGEDGVEQRSVVRAWYLGGRVIPEDSADEGIGVLNGHWCEAPQSRNGHGCLTIALPTYTIDDTGQTWDFTSVAETGNTIAISTVDAPFGDFYPAGVPIPAEALMGIADLPEQDRIWSTQSGMMLVRD